MCTWSQWNSAKVSQRASESNCGSCGQINLTKNNLKQHFWEFQLNTTSSVNRRVRGERRKTRPTDGRTDRTFGLESSLFKAFSLPVFSSGSSQLCTDLDLASRWPEDSSPQLWVDSTWTQEVLPVVVTRVPRGHADAL